MRQKQSPLLSYASHASMAPYPPILSSPLDLLLLPDTSIQPKIFEAWEAVIGRQLSQMSSPLDFSKGRLRILVRNAAWMREIDYIKGRYLHRINHRLGCHLLREILLVLEPPPPARSLSLATPDAPLSSEGTGFPSPTSPPSPSLLSASSASAETTAPSEQAEIPDDRELRLLATTDPSLLAKIEEQLADLPEDYFKNCARRLLLRHYKKQAPSKKG